MKPPLWLQLLWGLEDYLLVIRTGCPSSGPSLSLCLLPPSLPPSFLGPALPTSCTCSNEHANSILSVQLTWLVWDIWGRVCVGVLKQGKGRVQILEGSEKGPWVGGGNRGSLGLWRFTKDVRAILRKVNVLSQFNRCLVSTYCVPALSWASSSIGGLFLLCHIGSIRKVHLPHNPALSSTKFVFENCAMEYNNIKQDGRNLTVVGWVHLDDTQLNTAVP